MCAAGHVGQTAKHSLSTFEYPCYSGRTDSILCSEYWLFLHYISQALRDDHIQDQDRNHHGYATSRLA